MKEEIEELKFVNNETEEQVESWGKSINEELLDADTKVVAIRARLKKIDEEERAIERDQKRKEQHAADDEQKKQQLAFEQAKHEQRLAHKEQDLKQERDHERELMDQKRTLISEIIGLVAATPTKTRNGHKTAQVNHYEIQRELCKLVAFLERVRSRN